MGNRKAYKTEKWFVKKQEIEDNKHYQVIYLATGRGKGKIAIDNIATYAEALRLKEEIEKDPSKSPLSDFEKKFTKCAPSQYSKEYLEKKTSKEEIKEKSKLAFSALLKAIEKRGKNFIIEHDLEFLELESGEFWYELPIYLDYLTNFDYVEAYDAYTLGGKGYRNSYYKATDKGKAAFQKIHNRI